MLFRDVMYKEYNLMSNKYKLQKSKFFNKIIIDNVTSSLYTPGNKILQNSPYFVVRKLTSRDLTLIDALSIGFPFSSMTNPRTPL